MISNVNTRTREELIEFIKQLEQDLDGSDHITVRRGRILDRIEFIAQQLIPRLLTQDIKTSQEVVAGIRDLVIEELGPQG